MKQRSDFMCEVSIDIEIDTDATVMEIENEVSRIDDDVCEKIDNYLDDIENSIEGIIAEIEESCSVNVALKLLKGLVKKIR